MEDKAQTNQVQTTSMNRTKAPQKVEVVVENEKVNSVIDAIAEAAKTGEIGDGKIFITSIDSVMRIRTGDKDEEAL